MKRPPKHKDADSAPLANAPIEEPDLPIEEPDLLDELRYNRDQLNELRRAWPDKVTFVVNEAGQLDFKVRFDE